MSTIPNAPVAPPDVVVVDEDVGASATRPTSGADDGIRAIKGYSVPGEGPSTLISVVTVLALLVLWWVATHMGWIKDLFLPTPEKIFTSFGEAWRGDIQGGKPLTEHFWWSLYRVFAAFVLAVVTAVPVGIAMGVSRIARGIFDPPIEFYRPLPPLGLYTLLVMWLGIGESSKLALLFLAGLPGIVISTIQAVSSIDPIYVRAAQSLGAKPRDLVLYVYLPAAGPLILAGMRISLGFTYTVLVAAEIVAASSGIGWMIWDAAKFLLSDVVIMGLIVLGLTGVLLDLAMRAIAKLLMPWS